MSTSERVRASRDGDWFHDYWASLPALALSNQVPIYLICSFSSLVTPARVPAAAALARRIGLLAPPWQIIAMIACGQLLAPLRSG